MTPENPETPGEGGETTEPEVPVGPTYPTIAEVLESEENDEVETKGTVMAIHQRGFVLGDATGNIYVYTSSAPEVSVGNTIVISGTFDNYYGTLQMKNVTISENDEATAAPAYPTPMDLTDQATYDAFKSYSEDNPVDYPYVTVKGVLGGSYNNVITVGTSAKTTQLYYSVGDYSANVGKTVVATGYIIGFHSSNGYYQFIETSVTLAE